MKRPKNSNLLARALTSSFAGLPISYILNVWVSVPVTLYMATHNYDAITISAVLSVPFFIASTARMFTIDWAWFKYHINIEPRYLMHKLYHHFKYWFSMCKGYDSGKRGRSRKTHHGTQSTTPGTGHTAEYTGKRSTDGGGTQNN